MDRATATDGRRRAWRRGRRAEWLAAWSLRLRGYRVLARGFRVAAGEIDLIVRRGRLVAFVEVKAREAPAQAAEAVSARQRSRIARAAALFMAGRSELESCDRRFDVVMVMPWRWPRHVPDAWRPLD